MFENPKTSRQARNFTTNVPKNLDLNVGCVGLSKLTFICNVLDTPPGFTAEVNKIIYNFYFNVTMTSNINVSMNTYRDIHSRHQSIGSTQGSGKLYVGKHAPWGSYSQNLAI